VLALAETNEKGVLNAGSSLYLMMWWMMLIQNVSKVHTI